MIILTNEWPANMFANRRIPRLTALATYEINSIRIIKGAITVGVPVGYRIDKNLIPWIVKPIRTTVIRVTKLSVKATEASLVIVSIPGSIPKTFIVKITD